MIFFLVSLATNIFDAYILIMIASRFCTRRWNQKGSSLLFVLTWGIVITLCSHFITNNSISVPVIFILVTVFVCIFYVRKIGNFLVTIMLIGLIFISEIVAVNVMSLLSGRQISDIAEKDDIIAVLVVVLSKLLEYICAFSITKKFRDSLAQSFHSFRFIFLIVTAGIMFNTSILYIRLAEYKTISNFYLIYFFAFIVLYFVFLFFMIFKMESIAKENESNALINLENQLKKDYEENIKVMIEELRMLKHDYRFHLQTLRAMLDNHLYESAVDYFNGIKDGVEDFTKGYIEKYPATSTTLIKMSKQAREENIDFNIELQGKLDISIYDGDLNIVLSNVLENAFQAVRKIENKKRRISLELLLHKSCNIIIIENTYQGKVVMEKGKLCTVKKDKKKHGFGLKSVESIMNKYDGTLDIEVTEELFSAILSFPKK